MQGAQGSTPGWGTKIPHLAQRDKKIIKTPQKNSKILNIEELEINIKIKDFNLKS